MRNFYIRRKITEELRNDQQIYVTQEESDHTKIYDVLLTETGDNSITSGTMTMKGQENATNKVKFTFNNGKVFKYKVTAKHSITCFPTDKEFSEQETEHHLKYLEKHDESFMAYAASQAVKEYSILSVDELEINDRRYAFRYLKEKFAEDILKTELSVENQRKIFIYKIKSTISKILIDNLIYQNNEFDQRSKYSKTAEALGEKQDVTDEGLINYCKELIRESEYNPHRENHVVFELIGDNLNNMNEDINM